MFVSNPLDTREICNEAVKKCLYFFIYVPDLFFTSKSFENLDNDEDIDEFFEWCNGYKWRKAQKTQTKEVLEDEKKEIEKFWNDGSGVYVA